MKAFKLEALARAADVTPRTVRYYVQRGLLPPPEFRGKDTRYGPEHLARLRAIQHLQQAHLPLDEIAARLAAASPADLESLAASAPTDAPPAPPPEQLAPVPPGEPWERFVLAAGLELHLAANAGPHARDLARTLLAAPAIDDKESKR